MTPKLKPVSIVTGARIIFFSSSLTKASVVLPNALVYVATKGAIEQFSRVLAKDLGAKGITVNTVTPGPTDTELFRKGKSESEIESIANAAPLKRLGQPDEIAPVVSFLASPAAAWVNGQNILVNGASVFVLASHDIELITLALGFCCVIGVFFKFRH